MNIESLPLPDGFVPVWPPRGPQNPNVDTSCVFGSCDGDLLTKQFYVDVLGNGKIIDITRPKPSDESSSGDPVMK
jgi:hypothetical protein